MTDPSGPGGRSPAGRRSRRLPGRAPALLLVLIAATVLAVAVHLVIGGGRDVQLRGRATPPTGSIVPAPELTGEWTGTGVLARCAGFDQGCPAARPVVLTIDCSARPCTVTPFDGDHGSPPLAVEDGSYRAAGPVPPDLAPTCGGVPASTALWRLELTVRSGRLVGSYAESTLQGFDCGGTGVTWTLALDRSGR